MSVFSQRDSVEEVEVMIGKGGVVAAVLGEEGAGTDPADGLEVGVVGAGGVGGHAGFEDDVVEVERSGFAGTVDVSAGDVAAIGVVECEGAAVGTPVNVDVAVDLLNYRALSVAAVDEGKGAFGVELEG